MMGVTIAKSLQGNIMKGKNERHVGPDYASTHPGKTCMGVLRHGCRTKTPCTAQLTRM